MKTCEISNSYSLLQLLKMQAVCFYVHKAYENLTVEIIIDYEEYGIPLWKE